MLIRTRDILQKLLCLISCLLLVLGLSPTISAYAEGYSLGDINSDGYVNAVDASDVLICYSQASSGVELALTDTKRKAADVNRDGFVDASDASSILAYYSFISTDVYEPFADYIIDKSTSSPEYNTYYRSSTYLLYDLDDERLISYHDIHKRISPASFTKLLTAAVVLRYMDMDAVITVGSEQDLVQPYSSVCYLAKGNRLTVYDLLTGMLLNSGNDAAYTAAVNTARTVAGRDISDTEAVTYFCRLMNDFAAELNMCESCFVNPDGYDADGQYTTAADMLRLVRYSLTVPQIREITGTAKKTVTISSGEVFNWKNTNYLLDTSSKYYRPDAFGIKTGTTADAGTCLVAAFNKNGKTYITLVSGCSSDTTRYDLTISIIDTYT